MQIQNISDVTKAIDTIEENGEDRFTNLLANDVTLSSWINKKQVTAYFASTNIFIFRQRPCGKRLYFYSSNLENLMDDLKICLSAENEVIVFSILDRGDISSLKIRNIFSQAGFEHCAKIRRMSKLGFSKYTKNADVNFAKIQDTDQIAAILGEYFDQLIDEIPDRDEIENEIRNNSIIVMRMPESDKIASFILFEKKGRTVWLKYIVSRKECRSKAPYGRLILNEFLSMFSDVNRGILWVNDVNERAINLYLSSGYKFEDVTNYTFKFNITNCIIDGGGHYLVFVIEYIAFILHTLYFVWQMSSENMRYFLLLKRGVTTFESTKYFRNKKCLR